MLRNVILAVMAIFSASQAYACCAGANACASVYDEATCVQTMTNVGPPNTNTSCELRSCMWQTAETGSGKVGVCVVNPKSAPSCK